jgi:hypothetical protein
MMASMEVSLAQDILSYTGTVYVYMDDDDNIESAEIAVYNSEGVDYYSLLLNEENIKIVERLDGKEVEIKGRIVEKDDEEWLSIQSCFHVIYGQVQVVEKDDENQYQVWLLDEEDCSIAVRLDDKARRLAKDLGGRMVRAVGSIETGDGETFVLESFSEFISGTGFLEADKTEEGAIKSLRFVYQQKDSREIVAYEIKLDDEGKSLFDEFGKEGIEVRGIVINERNARWLKVLSCEYSYDDETEEDDAADWDDEMEEEEG